MDDFSEEIAENHIRFNSLTGKYRNMWPDKIIILILSMNLAVFSSSKASKNTTIRVNFSLLNNKLRSIWAILMNAEQ
jgi:hypothetical protein